MSSTSAPKVTIRQLYRRLGVSYSASQSEVKKAFYEKQRVYHPDKGGNEEVCKRLNEAYRILTDDELRAQHDISNDDEEDIYDQDQSQYSDTDKVYLMCCPLLSTILKKKIKKWVLEFDTLEFNDNFYPSLSDITKNVIRDEKTDEYVEEIFCSLCEKTFSDEEDHYEKAISYYDDLIIDSQDDFDYCRDSIFALLRCALGDSIYDWSPTIYSRNSIQDVWNNPLLMGIPVKFEKGWLSNWYEISEEALAAKNIFMAMVAARAGSEIDSDKANDQWEKIGFQIYDKDPLRAHVCFLSSCSDLKYIADIFFALGNHKAAITYYIQNGLLDILIEKGNQLLQKRDPEKGFLYFSVVIQNLEETEDEDDEFVVEKLIQIINHLCNFKGIQKEKMYRAIILTFPECFYSPVTLPVHDYLLEDAKNNFNLESAKILLAAAHFPDQTNVTEDFVVQYTKDVFSRFFADENVITFTALSEHLIFANSKTVGSLEDFLRGKVDFSRFGNEMKAILYVIKAVINKIAGEWQLAVENIENALTSAPGSLDKVTSCVANIFQDIKFHENILLEMLSNLEELNRNCLTKNYIDVTKYPFLLTKTSPDDLFKFSNIFQITGNLATLKKNEAGIKNRIPSKVHSALYYYDLSKGVQDATSVLGVLLMSMSKFLEAISVSEIPARIYAYRNAISEISRIVYGIALKYETPYMNTYAGRVAMSIIISANQKLSQAIVGLNWKNQNTITKMEQALTSFSGKKTSVDLFSKLDLAIFELFLRGNVEIAKVNPIVTTKMHSAFDMIYLDKIGTEFLQHFWNKKIGHGTFSTKLPFHLYAYHRFDAVWHKWFTSVDFEEARRVAMDALLQSKGWTVQDSEDLMNFPFIRRTPDGWLDNKNYTLNLGVPADETFSSVDGYEMNLETGEIKLLFSQRLTRLFSLEDVNEIFERGITWGMFTLDEPDCKMTSHPFYNGKYFPKKSLAGSSFLQTMAYVDILLKQFTLGVEINSNSYFEIRQSFDSVLQRLPLYFKRIVQAIADRKNESTLYESAHRFWVDFSKGEMEVFINDKDDPVISVQFGQMPVKINKHLLKRDENGELVDDEDNDKDDTPEGQFAREFTENYYAIGQYFPEMLRLTELMKLCVLNKLLIGTFKSKKQEIKEMQTADEFKDRIRSTILEFQGRLPSYPICTEWRVSSEMSSVLAENGVSRHQVASSELTRVENNIRKHLADADTHLASNAVNELSKAFHAPSVSLIPHIISFLERNATSLNAVVDLCVSSEMAVQINKKERLCKEILNLKVQPHKSDEDETTEFGNDNMDQTCTWYPAAFLSKSLWRSEKQSYSIKVHGGVLMNVGIKFATNPIGRPPVAGVEIAARQTLNATSRNRISQPTRAGNGKSTPRSGGGNSGGRSRGGNSSGQSSSSNSAPKTTYEAKVGPSGKPMRHFPKYSSRKQAKEAAFYRGRKNKPDHDGPHKKGQPFHYHAVDENGERITDGVHDVYGKGNIRAGRNRK